MRRFLLVGCLAVSIVVACGADDPSAANTTLAPGADASAAVEGGSVPAEGGVTEPAPASMETSLTQFGITWTFDSPHLTGQFANGDFWVVGPVTLQGVVPEPAGGRNGSVVNPAIKVGQGYDARGDDYDAKLGAKFPLAMTATSSLVSSASHVASNCKLGGGADGYKTYDDDCQGGPVRTQAVLTVVDAPPAKGTFRPPYAGSSFKPLFASSAIDWSKLPKLPRPASAPKDDDVLRHVERPWIDHMLVWTLQYSCATENMFCYGREIGNVVAEVAQYVLLDTPVQQRLAIRLIQLGIDNWGIVKNGGSWPADGGHMNGRKFPVVFAGLMLGDAAMAKPGPVSGEDGQTYIGSNGKALWGVDCEACFFGNGCELGGSCNNGRQDCRDPAKAIDACEGYRDCCTSVTWAGQALAVLLLGGKAAWDHDPFFAYVDRWMNGDVSGVERTGSKFVGDMWKTYRNTL